MANENSELKVSQIFKQKPEQWGLRGDPYLWDDLEQHFANYQLPIDEIGFCNELKLYIKHIAANHPKNQDAVYIERYAHGGMSSGCISLSFWADVAIPMLLERLGKIKTDGKGDK